MMQFTSKYPIRVDRDLAKKCGILPNYLGKSDLHRHGQILYKKKTIDWWIDQAPVPRDYVQKMIDVLYTRHCKETENYYSID